MKDRNPIGEPTAPGEKFVLVGGHIDWPTLPGYEIVRELGRGGMGVVYEAKQLSSDRRVALKLIRDGALAGPQERARFRLEAAAAARMHHPNIIEIYEVGEHQGRPYFAMELLESGSLDKYLAGKPQGARESAELVRTLALAIEHAHAQKIVHRDLKPANILLQTANPKISDFGLAKRLDSESTAWTQQGDILGTASYMAPEQAAGRIDDIGPAVDVYALGAILYELLIGRPPFHADTWNATVQQVLHEEPTPPSRFRAEVPCDLETICLKCLEKQPSRRYTCAFELADDLSRFLDAKPVLAEPLSREDRISRLAGRDGYEIVGKIGHGPRSTVYHALYGPIKQPIALKVFRTGMRTREQWETRVKQAADIWATLTHPNLVPIQRAGWWDGSAYVVTEFLPQRSLADSLAGKPYPIRQALHLMEQLVEIVSYLHRQGVIHGNLKPCNVLLAANDIPRLVDLRTTGGIFQEPFSNGDIDSTGLGYLAPEFLKDPSAEPRPYTDIYGLGLIGYELLTGKPPFAAEDGPKTLELIRTQEPAPPSKFNREVKPALDDFCLRCLRKNPWRRFERAYDMLSQLRQFREELGADRSTASRLRSKR